jgi:putative transcriptional regulator
MNFESHLPDAACLRELGERLARLRLNRNQTQAALAHEAGVSLRTVVRLEQGESVQLTNLLRVLRALDLLGNLEALAPESAASPLQQIRRQGRLRRRASAPRGKEAAREDEGGGEEADGWTWGEES